MIVVENHKKQKRDALLEKINREVSLGKVYTCGYERWTGETCKSKVKLEKGDNVWTRDSDKHFYFECPVCRNNSMQKFSRTTRENTLLRLAVATPVLIFTCLLFAVFF